MSQLLRFDFSRISPATFSLHPSKALFTSTITRHIAAGYTSSVVVKQKNVVNVNISLNLIGRLRIRYAFETMPEILCMSCMVNAVATQLI